MADGCTTGAESFSEKRPTRDPTTDGADGTKNIFDAAEPS